MNRKEFFRLLGGMTHGDLDQVQLAYWLAKNAHREQRRDSGERYFEHPRDVAIMLIERGLKEKDLIIKALLHDLVEDTNTPYPVIINLFGHDVWHSLFMLSKTVPVFDPVTGQTSARYHKPNEVYYTELLNAPEDDRLVKCADRLINLRDMREGWSLERQIKKAEETRKHILPIAEKTDLWFCESLNAEVKRICAA